MIKKMCLALLCLCGVDAFTDIILPGHHTVLRSAYIRNVSAFPDYAIIASVAPPSRSSFSAHLVQDFAAIQLGYRFYFFNLYAAKRTVLESNGGLNAIHFDVLTKTFPGAQVTSLNECTVQDANPLIRKTLCYEITGVDAKSMTIVLKERHFGYNDGTPDKIELF